MEYVTHPLTICQPHTHSVASLKQLIDGELTFAIRKHFADGCFQIHLSGRLGVLTESKYTFYYDVPLSDSNGNVVLLDIPKSLLSAAKLQGGEWVMLVGELTAKWKDYKDEEKIVLKVSAMQTEDSPDEVKRKRQDQIVIDALKALPLAKANFPYQSEINLSILCAKQSQVLADFESEVNKLGPTIASKEVLRINMVDAQEIAQAINSAKGNVLVVLRGGGEASQFECFDKMIVLEALTKFNGYRLLGLGHTQHTTLADLVCDHTSNTPAQAGVHLVQVVRSYEADLQIRLTDLRKVSQNHIKELGNFLARSYDSIDQLKAENQAKNESMSQLQKQFKRLLLEKDVADQRIQNTRRLAKFYLPFMFALGMIFTHWFVR